MSKYSDEEIQNMSEDERLDALYEELYEKYGEGTMDVVEKAIRRSQSPNASLAIKKELVEALNDTAGVSGGIKGAAAPKEVNNTTTVVQGFISSSDLNEGQHNSSSRSGIGRRPSTQRGDYGSDDESGVNTTSSYPAPLAVPRITATSPPLLKVSPQLEVRADRDGLKDAGNANGPDLVGKGALTNNITDRTGLITDLNHDELVALHQNTVNYLAPSSGEMDSYARWAELVEIEDGSEGSEDGSVGSDSYNQAILNSHSSAVGKVSTHFSIITGPTTLSTPTSSSQPGFTDLSCSVQALASLPSPTDPPTTIVSGSVLGSQAPSTAECTPCVRKHTSQRVNVEHTPLVCENASLGGGYYSLSSAAQHDSATHANIAKPNSPQLLPNGYTQVNSTGRHLTAAKGDTTTTSEIDVNRLRLLHRTPVLDEPVKGSTAHLATGSTTNPLGTRVPCSGLSSDPSGERVEPCGALSGDGLRPETTGVRSSARSDATCKSASARPLAPVCCPLQSKTQHVKPVQSGQSKSTGPSDKQIEQPIGKPTGQHIVTVKYASPVGASPPPVAATKANLSDGHDSKQGTEPVMEHVRTEATSADGTLVESQGKTMLSEKSWVQAITGGGPNQNHGNAACSWTETLGRDTVGKDELDFIPPTMVDGKAVVHIKSDDFEEAKLKFGKLVVGSFIGRRLPYSLVKETCRRNWKLKSDFVMEPQGDKMYVFEFKNEDDRRSVLDVGSFHIASNLFIVRPWRLFIETESTNLKTIPIWIILRNFPMELWNREGFSKVGSAVGRPLFTDKRTEEPRRNKFARLCIEIDAKCQYPSVVPVIVDETRIIHIPVEYSWRPPICKQCAVFGHLEATCPNQIKPVQQHNKSYNVWLQKNKSTPTQNPNSVLALTNLSEVNTIAEGDQDTSKQTTLTEISIEAQCGNEEKGSEVADDEEGWERPKKKHSFKVGKQDRVRISTTSKGQDSVQISTTSKGANTSSHWHKNQLDSQFPPLAPMSTDVTVKGKYIAQGTKPNPLHPP